MMERESGKYKKKGMVTASVWLFFGIFLFSLVSSSFAQKETVRITLSPQNLNLVEELKMIKVKEGINRITFGPVSKGIVLDSIYPRAEGCQFLEQKCFDGLLSWKIESTVEGEIPFRIAYLTTDLSWRLNYQVEVDKETKFMDLFAWGSIENKSGINFFQAYLTLAVEISPPEGGRKANSAGRDIPDLISISPDFSYSLPYPIDLKNGERKQVLLFCRKNISVERTYLFDGAKYGEEVREELVFENRQEKGLGIFLPPGEVYIYKIGPEDRITSMGKDNFSQTLPAEKANIYLGLAKGLEGERIQTSYYQSEPSEKEYSYKIILYNLRDLPVEVKVLEHFYGKWEILESQPPEYKKEDDLIIYQLEIPAQGRQEVQYKARTKQ